MLYTAPKTNWKARVASPAALLVLPDCAKIAAAMVMQSQVTEHAIFENRRSGRRPNLSTRVAPQRAKKNCWQALPSERSFC